jgi:hypothetical protein
LVGPRSQSLQTADHGELGCLLDAAGTVAGVQDWSGGWQPLPQMGEAAVVFLDLRHLARGLQDESLRRRRLSNLFIFFLINACSTESPSDQFSILCPKRTHSLEVFFTKSDFVGFYAPVVWYGC